jgi:uncharacterized protein YxjI
MMSLKFTSLPPKPFKQESMKTSVPAHLRILPIAFLIIVSILIPNASFAAIGVGKTVRITENSVNVRSSYGTSASVLGQQNTGAQGTVTDGPQTANSFTWWRVNFSSGVDGWVASLYLQEVVSAPAPSISSVSPSSMPASGSDQTLTIDGSNFVSGATLTFNPPTGSNINSTASKLTFVSSTRIRYQINNGNDAGTWSVRVTNPDGNSSGWTSFTVAAPSTPSPSISSVSPSSIPASSSDQTLTINGSNFVSGATLTFDPPTGSNINSTASKLTFVSSSQIRYQINNGNDAGTWSVRVTNPDGKSSGWSTFTVTGGTSTTPAITNVSPTSMPASSSDQTLTINGSNFVSGATLTFDPPTGSNLSSVASKLTFVSSSQIRYQINNANDVGTWSVRVTNPNGNSSGWTSFTVTAATTPSPAISSVSPTSMAGSSSDQTLTINGSNFVSGATLTFDPPTGSNLNSTPSKLTFVSTSQIRYQINNANDVGTWSVRVTNPDGKTSGWSSFIVTAATTPSPSISSVSPTSMPGSNTDQTLTINGSNFVSGATLTFDPPTGSNLNSIPSKLTFVSASQIRYQINNANDLGTWSVRVTNPDGKTSGWTSFVVAAPVTPTPSISSITPTSIPASTGDQTLTINGSNFVSGATLTFDPPTGSNLTSNPAKLSFVSAGQIRYLINNDNDAGTWSMRVTNPDGKTSGWATFTVTAPAVPGDFTLTHEAPYWDKRDPAGPAVLLKWTQASGATSYEVYRDNSLIKTGVTGTSFRNETGMSQGQSYTFRVVARNANGNRDSNTLSVGPMPGPPTNEKPDLIVVPGSITFSPSSVRAGEQIRTNVQIRNLGNVATPRAKIRLRLSLDTNLTASDLPLSPLDLELPPVPAQGTVSVSGTANIPLSTPNGSYFVGVFADPTDETDQSDTTNDGGTSVAKLQVSAAAGVIAPQILTDLSSEPRQILSGGLLELRVEATGSNLYYEWMRDLNPIKGRSGLNLNEFNMSVTEPGEYWVRISNSADTVESRKVPVAIDSSRLPPLQRPVRGELRHWETFNPDLPTVIITHGWQPQDSAPALDEWMTPLRSSILRRTNNQANVLLFTWPQASTYVYEFDSLWFPSFVDDRLPVAVRTAYNATETLGDLLAKELSRVLGKGTHNQTIHFIGHSFGTLVNARAITTMSIPISQVTILDAPTGDFAARYIDPSIKNFFHTYDWSLVGYYDNYIATILDKFGTPIPGARPGNGGYEVPFVSHSNIHKNFYLRTADLATASDRNYTGLGFNNSVLLNTERTSPVPGPSSRQFVVNKAIELGEDFVQDANRIIDNVKGKFTPVIQFLLPSFFPSMVEDSESSDAVTDTPIVGRYEVDITIPEDADILTFDLFVADPGDGDWMSVVFNGVPIYAFSCDSFSSDDYNASTIPISEFRGTTSTLKFLMLSQGSSPSDVRIANLRFLSISESESISTLNRPTNLRITRSKSSKSKTNLTLSVRDNSTGPRLLSFQKRQSRRGGGWAGWRSAKTLQLDGAPRNASYSLSVSRRSDHQFRARASSGAAYLYSNSVTLRGAKR